MVSVRRVRVGLGFTRPEEVRSVHCVQRSMCVLPLSLIATMLELKRIVFIATNKSAKCILKTELILNILLINQLFCRELDLTIWVEKMENSS